MNILIVSQYFWPENFRINDLTQELVKRGHQVTVLTGIPNYPSGQVFDAFQKNPSAFATYEGARILRVPMLPRSSGSARLLLNYLSFVIGASLWGPSRLCGVAVDVIFVFEPSPITVGLPAILLGRLKRAPIVFWALDLWPETLEAIGVVKSKKVLGLIGKMVKFIYDNCTLVLGQSKGFLKNIEKYCADREKILYFPSWAEEVYGETQPTPAPEVPLRKDLFNIVFAGNIGEAQDMPAVLDVAEILKNDSRIRWIIVGDGRKHEWMADEIKRRGLQKNVLMLGRFPVERMPSFYAHADALLASLKKNPVFSLTIPGKIQSYLMSGIPLLGMLDGEGAAVIHDARAGLSCPAGDSIGLAKAVKQLAEMPKEDRIQLGKNGLSFAKTEFHRPMLMDRLDKILTEAVTRHSQGKSNKA